MTLTPQVLLIVDTETTGIETDSSSLCEIGAVLFSLPHRSVLQQVSFLLPITENQAAGINGIAPEVTQLEQPVQQATELFLAMARRADVAVAHNAAFDRSWIEPLLQSEGLPWVCSCEGMRWPGIRRNPSLTELALAHGVPVWAAHRALTDCIYLAQVFERHGDMEARIAEALEPRSEVVALVSYGQREQAKAAGFRWDPAAKHWSRQCSQSEIDALPFRVMAVA